MHFRVFFFKVKVQNGGYFWGLQKFHVVPMNYYVIHMTYYVIPQLTMLFP